MNHNEEEHQGKEIVRWNGRNTKDIEGGATKREGIGVLGDVDNEPRHLVRSLQASKT